MEVKPTIVTAFFDLNRENWENSGRTNKKYLDSFEFWAGIKNDIVIYTNAVMAEAVKEIRNKKGMLDRTKVIIVENYLELDPELYNCIDKAMSSDVSLNFHLHPSKPESCNPVYNYIMLMKWWCVCDAINKGLTNETVAWIDFGFNNCGTYYTDSTQFDFEWKWDFEDKINVFCINEIDNTPIFEIVQKMETYIQGCSLIAPAKLWPDFWNLVRESMIEMTNIGLCDDDQVFILMAYRKHPELFKLNYGPWFSVFHMTSNVEFKIREKVKVSCFKSKIREIRKKIYEEKCIKEYIKKQKMILKNRNTIND